MARRVSFGQIVDKARIEANIDPNPALSQNATPLIKQIVRREYDRLYEEFDWPFLRVKRDIEVSAGHRLYDFPLDMNLERIERVDVYWNNDWIPVERGISPENYNAHDSEGDERFDPVMCWDVADTGTPQIEVWPLPASNNIKLRIIGIRKLTELLADDDLCDLDDVMIYLFAASELLARKQSPEASTKQQKAVERFRLMKGRSIQTKKNSFSFSVKPSPGNHTRTPRVAYVRNPE